MADRPGRRIGIDVGEARVGVAVSDADGILATPVETVRRRKGRADESDIRRIRALVREYAAVEVVVGIPLHLSGHRGAAAETAAAYAERVARAVDPVPVRLVDERLTTVEAERWLRDMDPRERRSVVDQAAAVVILQSHLDRIRGRLAQPPGPAFAHDPGEAHSTGSESPRHGSHGGPGATGE